MTSTLPEAERRADTVRIIMATVRTMVSNPDRFEPVHPARWRHFSGCEVETGYSHGEGRVRIYKPINGELLEDLRFNGSPGCEQLATLIRRFPEYQDTEEPVNY